MVSWVIFAAEGRVRRRTSGEMSTTPEVWVSRWAIVTSSLPPPVNSGSQSAIGRSSDERALFDQLHQRGGENRLGDRGQEEQSTGATEAACPAR